MFKAFSQNVHARYVTMAVNELYTTAPIDIYASYLAAFPAGSNEIFRVRTEHDCNCCKNFIRRLGHLVGFTEEGARQTVWDNWQELPEPYRTVGAAMQALVLQAPLQSVFRTKEQSFGAEKTPDNHENKMWDHFYGHVNPRHRNPKPDEAIGIFNTTAHVFRRGLEELNADSFDTVIGLIEANDLYRGAEYLSSIKEFQKVQRMYRLAPDQTAFIFMNLDTPVARFRNTVMGTLLTDLSDGVEIEKAVRAFETKVAPSNFKRSTSPVSPKMVEGAVAKIKELGLESAIHRRHARLSDVSVNDVLWVDGSARTKMKDALTELLIPETTAPVAKIDRTIPINIDEFMDEVAPNADAISILVKNNQVNNLVSITGADGDERLFKWDNNFAWSYNGDVTDSIKERVKKAGGRVEGAAVRVSLSWFNHDDLDIHCDGPTGRIYYGNKANVLDVDMNNGNLTNEPVENLSWMSIPRDGVYRIYVNQYSRRSTENVGFILETEIAGKLEQYVYDKAVVGSVDGLVMKVMDGKITIEPALPGGTTSKNVWNIKTETLVPVDTVMLSPNFWGDRHSGNKHWFFMLRGCENPDAVRGIYNEYLRSDLYSEHRKVFELLGQKTKVQPGGEQLSGIGFSSTRKDEAIVVVKNGTRQTAYNVSF